MTVIANIIQAREPEQSSAVGIEERGWGLRPAKENAAAQTTAPAGLILTPRQFEAMGLSKEWAFECNEFESLFEPLYTSLEEAFRTGDLARVDEIGSAYLRQKRTEPLSSQPAIFREIYRFFVYRGAKSTFEEKLGFIEGFDREELEQYLRGARQHLDVLKAETLARLAVRDLNAIKENPVAQIRATFAVTVLVSEKKRGWNFDISKTAAMADHAIAMPALGPAAMFDNKPCSHREAEDHIVGPAGEVIQHEAAYESPLGAALRRNQAMRDQIDDVRRENQGHADDQHEHGHPANMPSNGKTCDCEEEAAQSDCECDCEDAPCIHTDPCCGTINYYVTDLLELREKTVCYEASDLAYIENVPAKQKLVRKHGFAKTIEDYTEEEITESRSEERNHMVNERSKLAKTIDEQNSASLDVEAKVNGGTYSVESNMSLSRDVAKSEAREKFREMVSKATQKIEKETRKLTSRRVTTEMTETNKHVIDNDGSEAFVDKYFYVNQVKEAQVYSHGLRLMLDLLIPFPAARYHELVKRKEQSSFDLEKPLKPCLSPSDLEPGILERGDAATYRDLWEYLVCHYGLDDLPKPPKPFPSKPPIAVTMYRDDATKTITIPEGYRATQLRIVGGHVDPKYYNATMWLTAGDATVEKNYRNGDVQPTGSMSNTGSVSVSVRHSWAEKDAHIKVEIVLVAIPKDFEPWQEEVHAAILAKYRSDLESYNRALEENSFRHQEERKNMHPFIAKEHMLTQLKQSAIHMMCDRFDDDVINMRAKPCGYPEIQREAAQEATSRWRFFDAAFNWKQAEYIFFDYFRTPMCKWAETFDVDESNYLFKAFLQAGYARIQLPVRPSMEEDVLTYFRDGMPWGGDTAGMINPADGRYVGVVDELKHQKDCYQNDRVGTITAIVDSLDFSATNTVQLTFDPSDVCRYWSGISAGTSGSPVQTEIAKDLDREIFIDSVPYRILDIVHDSSKSAGTAWIITLDRLFESQAQVDISDPPDPSLGAVEYKHAIGALFIGAPFQFALPTDLIWLGDQGDKCLPRYPVECEDCSDLEQEND